MSRTISVKEDLLPYPTAIQYLNILTLSRSTKPFSIMSSSLGIGTHLSMCRSHQGMEKNPSLTFRYMAKFKSYGLTTAWLAVKEQIFLPFRLLIKIKLLSVREQMSKSTHIADFAKVICFSKN